MGQRILVAEDSPTQAEALRCLLEAEGYEVDCVSDGHAAVRALREHPIEMLLSDLTMPGMSGRELMRAVRADPRLRDLPIVFMSGLDPRTPELRAIHGAADGWIVKPIDVAELVRVVRTLLETHDAHPNHVQQPVTQK
jgi:CheY-like chemotaxis protein